MKVTEREETLVQEMQIFCEKYQNVLNGMVFFGRCLRKMEHLKKNDPLALMISHIESAASCLSGFCITIYNPTPDKTAVFAEYNGARFGEYPNSCCSNSYQLTQILEQFSKDLIEHLSAIDAILSAENRDHENKIILPNDIIIPNIINSLKKIISVYYNW